MTSIAVPSSQPVTSIAVPSGPITPPAPVVPTINVNEYVLVSKPYIYINTRPAPVGLPVNTVKMFPPQFVTKAILRDTGMKILAGILGIAGAIIQTVVVPRLPLNIGVVVPTIYISLAFLLLLMYARSKAVRPAIILRKDAYDRPHYDCQEWWTADERKWPDTWRIQFGKDSILYRGRRVLYLDALEYVPEWWDHAACCQSTATTQAGALTKTVVKRVFFGRVPFPRKTVWTRCISGTAHPADLTKIFPINPNLSPLNQRPEGMAGSLKFPSLTALELSGVFAAGVAGRRLLGSFTAKQAKLRQLFLFIAIGIAAVLATWGGMQASKVYSGKDKEELANGIRAELFEQLRKDGILAPQPQPAPVKK